MTVYQSMPKLCDAVGIRFDVPAAFAVVAVGTEEFKIRFDSSAIADGVEGLVKALREGTRSIEDLSAEYGSAVSPLTVEEVVEHLDSQNLMTDAGPPSTDSISGRAFISEVQSYFQYEVLSLHPPDAFTELMSANRIDDGMLSRWSLEYYFVTRFAEQCVIGSVCQAHSAALRTRLEEFFLGEVGHQHMLRRSLLSMGYEESWIDAQVPHLSTDATMGLLLKSSLFDLPLFIALVWQMEGTKEESDQYIQVLNSSNLPEAAKAPQIAHELINTEFDHANEGRSLAALLDQVSLSDLARCKLGLLNFFHVRSAITPYIVNGGTKYADRTKDEVALCIRQALDQWLIETVPVALLRLNGSAGSSLLGHLRRARANDGTHFARTAEADVLSSMIGLSLWKMAFQQPDLYLVVIESLLSIRSQGSTSRNATLQTCAIGMLLNSVGLCD